jgi:hypothetical protein
MLGCIERADNENWLPGRYRLVSLIRVARAARQPAAG